MSGKQEGDSIKSPSKEHEQSPSSNNESSNKEMKHYKDQWVSTITKALFDTHQHGELLMAFAIVERDVSYARQQHMRPVKHWNANLRCQVNDTFLFQLHTDHTHFQDDLSCDPMVAFTGWLFRNNMDTSIPFLFNTVIGAMGCFFESLLRWHGLVSLAIPTHQLNAFKQATTHLQCMATMKHSVTGWRLHSISTFLNGTNMILTGGVLIIHLWRRITAGSVVLCKYSLSLLI